MKLTKNCLTTGTGQVFCTSGATSLKFYLNGERSNNLLNTEIRKNDEALITYGAENEEEVEIQLKNLSELK